MATVKLTGIVTKFLGGEFGWLVQDQDTQKLYGFGRGLQTERLAFTCSEVFVEGFRDGLAGHLPAPHQAEKEKPYKDGYAIGSGWMDPPIVCRGDENPQNS